MKGAKSINVTVLEGERKRQLAVGQSAQGNPGEGGPGVLKSNAEWFRCLLTGNTFPALRAAISHLFFRTLVGR